MTEASPRPAKWVVAALVRQGETVLVSKRRLDQPMPGLWELPGGKIESGESPQAALKREILEELGCEIAVGRIFEVVFHPYATFDLYMLVYECRIARGAPTAVAVAEVTWKAIAELPALQWLPADLPLIETLVRG